jgi:hypothetical protein
MKRILAFAVAALTVSSAQAQVQQPLAFVACPIMRDTATVPCWLAEYKGERYSIAAQEGSSAPALGHQALIEGTPTAQTRCGGKVLTDLHISVLPDRDPSCDTILPASDAFQVSDQPRGAGPGNASAAAAAPAAPPRVGSQRFEVLYDFDWQTAGRETQVIQEAAAYAKANPKAELRVQGYRASVRLAGGQVLAEEEGIDLRRARELVETLVTLGVDRSTALVVDNPVPELGDHTLRRAVIEVVMSGSDEHSEH